MTPAFCISRQSSWPSRIRSPTPAKTETPLWSFSTACMNSMMRTVLPTPAPPNSPVFPPRINGHRRSMTLMPVSSTVVAALALCNGPGFAMMFR